VDHTCYGVIYFSKSVSFSVDNSTILPLCEPENSVENEWTDHTTCVNDDSTVFVRGEIHIVLHPTYDIPCPLLRLWNDKTGEIVDQHRLNQLLQSLFPQLAMSGVTNGSPRETGTSSLNAGDGIDYRKNPLNVNDGIILTPELHPSCPSKGFYYSIHLCELEKSFRLMMEEHEENQVTDSGVSKKSGLSLDCKKLMLLSWLTMFGKYIGISITPQVYRKLLLAT
jgi:hypothetical protein